MISFTHDGDNILYNLQYYKYLIYYIDICYVNTITVERIFSIVFFYNKSNY